MFTLRTAVFAAGLLAVSGCKKEQTPAPAGPDGKPGAAAPQGAIPGAPSLGQGGPAAPAGGGLVGTVAERLEAPNYTYLKLTTDQGEQWAAVPTTDVAVGTKVTITSPMPMQNFESKTLGRKFDVIMFGGAAVVGGEGGAVPAGAGPQPGEGAAPLGMGMPQGDPHAGQNIPRPSGPAVDLANIKVEKAAGSDGRTVAEVYAERAGLKDKTVTVKGKVVKVTSGVLGRNWLHVRDGSGSDGSQDNDLIVTTTANASVNDVVTLQGTVRTDKDLGSGYSYKVLIEDAQLKQ